jgi:hypothetical protein
MESLAASCVGICDPLTLTVAGRNIRFYLKYLLDTLRRLRKIQLQNTVKKNKRKKQMKKRRVAWRQAVTHSYALLAVSCLCNM